MPVLAVAGRGQDGDGVHGLDQGALGQGLRHHLAAVVRSHVSDGRGERETVRVGLAGWLLGGAVFCRVMVGCIAKRADQSLSVKYNFGLFVLVLTT